MNERILTTVAAVVASALVSMVLPPAAADGASVDKLLRRASRQYDKGDLEDAAELYGRADGAAGGRSLPALRGLCQVALDLGRPDEAIGTARRWIELAPTPADAAGGHRCLGIALFQEALRASSAANPEADVAGESSQPLGAAADSLQVAADHSTRDRASILLDLADVFVRLDRYAEAAEVLHQYRGSGGGDPYAEQLRCWIEHEQGRARTGDRPAPAAPGPPGSGLSLPVRLDAPSPSYTSEARVAGARGTMRLSALLDEEGRVTCARVLQGVERGLDRAAVATLRRWRFEPARLNGEPVPLTYNLTVDFSLEPTMHYRVRQVGPYVVVRGQPH